MIYEKYWRHRGCRNVQQQMLKRSKIGREYVDETYCFKSASGLDGCDLAPNIYLNADIKGRNGSSVAPNDKRWSSRPYRWRSCISNWSSPGNQALQMGVSEMFLFKSLSGVDHNFLWSVLHVGVALHDENVFNSSNPFAFFDCIVAVLCTRR